MTSSEETAAVTRLLLFILFILHAQSAVSQDSSADLDSVVVPVVVDSVSLVAVTDSTALAQADSSAAGEVGGMAGFKEAVGGSLDPKLDLGPLLPPWTQGAAIDRRAMDRLRARGMDEIVEAIPHSYLRVAGDRAFPAYYDLTPIDGATVESFYDGIPGRSPADMDPGIWDLSAMGTGYADRSRRGMGGAMGGSALELERKPAEWGTTLLRAHFSKSDYESYLRGSLRHHAAGAEDLPSGLRGMEDRGRVQLQRQCNSGGDSGLR